MRAPRTNHCPAPRPQGFTMIELMTTLTVIAVLTAVVLPAYVYYLQRARIPEATGALAAKQVAQEQLFQDSRSYFAPGTSACSTSGMAGSSYFSYAFSACTATSYVLAASGKAGTNMVGFTFTIDHNGNRATTTVPNGWAPASNCWVTAKGGRC
ncbi:type IV pilin protein [Curvibacter sp. HBC28]|uniref:Type IV pilin protein n=1 Tax=Curvibacter microcysteis TaxID=3026419 RepID=A0ABT5MM06_9BURK|nr:type IV pilin protein [Curvibacter sp. HBC28]MDD0816872.1 type IV pilin protein [Curvibacter sp. HBC28]